DFKILTFFTQKMNLQCVNRFLAFLIVNLCLFMVAAAPIQQDTIPGIISVLDDTTVNLGSWQACGATTEAGIGGTASLLRPNTVIGNCKNGNIHIT
ncbi:12299_t:CDS:1, partial [Ambispora gerdemannii]